MAKGKSGLIVSSKDYEKADKAKDKKQGIKENSTKDKKIDKAAMKKKK